MEPIARFLLIIAIIAWTPILAIIYLPFTLMSSVFWVLMGTDYFTLSFMDMRITNRKD